MPRRFELTTQIPASREQAWAVFSNLPAWAEWSRLVPRAEGTLTAGARLTLSIRGPRGKLVTRSPVILAIDPPARLGLAMSVGAGWIVHMVHTFTFESAAPDRSVLRQRWDTTGAFALPLWPVLRRMMAGFSEFGDDLARRVSAG